MSNDAFWSWPVFHPIGRQDQPVRRRVRRFAAAAALLALGACAAETVTAPQTPAQEPRPDTPPVAVEAPAELPALEPLDTGPRIYRVGLLVPLAGAPGQVGRDLLDAAQMAMFDLADGQFELLPRDSGASAEAALAATTALIEEDRVDLILGPLLSDSVRAVAPTARAAGVPLIAFSNDRAVASDGVYVLGFAPQEQVRRTMGFARARGFGQFAALMPLNEYGQLMAQATADSAAALGVGMADTAYYPTDPGDTTGRTEVVKRLADYERRQKALEDQRRDLAARDDEISRRTLKRLEILDTLGDVGFDALVLPAGGNTVRELAPLLAFFDVDPSRVKLLGTWLWDDPSLGEEPTLVGAWFAAPPPEAREDFVARFESIYDRPPSRLATLGYDATALAAVLARRAAVPEPETDAEPEPEAATPVVGVPATPPASPYTVEALTSANGFAGMDGIFRLLPDGRTERGLAVLEIRPEGLITIDPAPQSFEAVVN